jgi:hypothetical protein
MTDTTRDPWCYAPGEPRPDMDRMVAGRPMQRIGLTYEDRTILHRVHGPGVTGYMGALDTMDEITMQVCSNPAASCDAHDVRIRQFCNAFRGLPVDEAVEMMRNA